MTDAVAFRSQFPVLAQRSYLNTGTCGPVPACAQAAAEAAVAEETFEGRSGAEHFARLGERCSALRAGYARWLGCDPSSVALTTSTTAGVNTVVSGLGLGRGDEVLASDEEHPGVLAPLAAARARLGIEIRTAPLAELANAVGPRTRLIACSHVSWVGGRVADTDALAAAGPPLLLDGAQGLGARELDMDSLGCDFYAASGQKWMCGPDGSGALYVRPERTESLHVPAPGYPSLADTAAPLELRFHEGARRFDTGALPSASLAWALASLEVLEEAGRAWMAARASALASGLADALRDGGADVVARDESTLVAWREPDPDAAVSRLAAAGILVRRLPARDLVRASVGAWSTEAELGELAAAVVATR